MVNKEQKRNLIQQILEVGDMLIDCDDDHLLILSIKDNGKALWLEKKKVIGLSLTVADFEEGETLWRDGVQIWPK